MMICGDLSLPTKLRDVHSVLCCNFTSDTWPACANFNNEVFRNVTPCFLEVTFCFFFFRAGKRKFVESQKLFTVSQNLVKRRRKMIGLCKGEVSLEVDPLI